MKKESGLDICYLRVDGGASANNLLMQLQADNANVIIQRPECIEVSSLGAALLSGLGAGVYADMDELKRIAGRFFTFDPQIDDAERASRISKWHKAVERSKGWDL